MLGLIVGAAGGDDDQPALDPAQARARAEQALVLAHLRPRPLTPAERRARRESAALARVRGYTPFVSQGSPNNKEVALTFDDGPSTYTPQILEILNRAKVPATFFAVGEEFSDGPNVLPAAIKQGHVVANHTQTHPMMGDLSKRDQEEQLDRQAAAAAAAGVRQQPLYRPPFGSYDKTSLKLLEERGLLMVLWSVDTQDYTQPGADAIVQTVLSQVKPGAIVLMHDGGGDRTQTVAALPRIIRELRAQGYKLVTVPQLMSDDPPRQQDLPQNLASSGA